MLSHKQEKERESSRATTRSTCTGRRKEWFLGQYIWMNKGPVNGDGNVAELAELHALNGENVVVAGDGGVAGVDGGQGGFEPNLGFGLGIDHESSNGVLQLALGVQNVLLAISQTLLDIRAEAVVVDENLGLAEDPRGVGGSKPKGDDGHVFEVSVRASEWVRREDLNAEVSGWGEGAHLLDQILSS